MNKKANLSPLAMAIAVFFIGLVFVAIFPPAREFVLQALQTVFGGSTASVSTPTTLP